MQYADGSMLCKKNPYFSLWKHSLKFKMLWFFESRLHHLLKSIAKIAHFYILTLPGEGGGGVTLTKNKKKCTFSKVVGEIGHNSINIRASALNPLAFDREQNVG